MTSARCLARLGRAALRDPFTIVFGLQQPLFFLGLFGPPLAGVQGASIEAALQWFVAGVLVMLALYGTSFTGANLLTEMQTGSHERMLLTPLSRSSLLIGRALKEIAPTVAQAVVIVAVTLPFGFRFPPLAALVGLLILCTFSVGLGALSYSLALASRNREWLFWVVQQTLIFPMLILSGMLLPLETGPAWLRAAALANPLSYIVDAQRALFSGGLFEPAVLGGVISAGLTVAVGLTVGTRAMRRAGG